MSTRFYLESDYFDFTPQPDKEREHIQRIAEVQGAVGSISDVLGRNGLTYTPIRINEGLAFRNRSTYNRDTPIGYTELWGSDFIYQVPSPHPNNYVLKRTGAFTVTLVETGPVKIQSVELYRDYHWQQLSRHQRMFSSMGFFVPTQEMQNRMLLFVTPSEITQAEFENIGDDDLDPLTTQVVDKMVNEAAEMYAAFMQSDYYDI